MEPLPWLPRTNAGGYSKDETIHTRRGWVMSMGRYSWPPTASAKRRAVVAEALIPSHLAHYHTRKRGVVL